MCSYRAVGKIPKKFKSSSLFNFHSDFAKIPASSEFFAEIYDPNELRAEKEAILLSVLSDEFLAEQMHKYLGAEQAELEWRVQGLRKDIRFVPLSRTTYQLIVEQGDPAVAQSIAWDVLDRLEESLKTDRLIRMQSVYASITQQLNELGAQGSDKDLTLQMSAARLRIEKEIEKLQMMYTSEHPRLARLRNQLSNLTKTYRSDPQDPIGRGQIENWSSLRGILLTRQALLQVAIRMEEKGTLSHIKIVKDPDLPQWPASPKKNILYVSAFLTSAVVAFGIVAIFNLLSDLLIFFPEIQKSWGAFKKTLRKNQTDKE